MKTLRLILGDQLNPEHSWFDKPNDDCLYVMMEMKQELTYVKHHVQKVVAFFLAMRQFKLDLEAKGHRFLYLTLDDPENRHLLDENLKNIITSHKIQRFEYQLPDEFRLDEQLKLFCQELNIAYHAMDTEHFLTKRNDLGDFFKGKKQWLMESFYRHMRKKHGILMEGTDPTGGHWNFDHDNRNKMPKDVSLPVPKIFPKKVESIPKLLDESGVVTFGHLDPKKFIWPVSQDEAKELFDYFLSNLLPQFGRYQDAMTTKGWSLFHSRISFALNTKILNPKYVIEAAEEYYRQHEEDVPLSAVEGFIRQVLGWREYMRGIYWHYMPDYASTNFFDHDRALPDWYWTGKTKMKCLSHSIEQSLDYAYAHHIQRLMVTGNFALLAGIDPNEVDAWYLGVYIDAIEWVEITNTRGMSQFADGGVVATKPYVASANYMHKMGHYCSQCHYNYKLKTGEGACPFNSLYWHFIDRNKEKLGKNPRMGMIYRVWDKNSEEKKNQILQQADTYLHQLNEL